MGFKVPDYKQSIKQNVYSVDFPEKSFEIPKFKYLKGEFVDKLGRPGEFGGPYAVLDEIADGLGVEFKALPFIAYEEFMKDWQSDSGVTVGESKASENS
ncbi:hypothetical protein [Pseudoclavibacter helvolus]|uniref:hypothetical protein n=1 Tax=Pseudoclavibacter helvolus TaxID=255205 RepID=UPI003C717C74